MLDGQQFPPFKHFVQLLCGKRANALMVRANGRKRRSRARTKLFVVVHTDHRNFVRDAQRCVSARLKHLYRPVVKSRKDPDRFRKPFQPSPEFRQIISFYACAVDRNIETVAFHLRDERFAAQPAPLASRQCRNECVGAVEPLRKKMPRRLPSDAFAGT